MVELNKEEWLEWTKNREMVDAIHGQPRDAEINGFKDLQLLHALEFLSGTGPAESALPAVTPAVTPVTEVGTSNSP